MSVFQWVKKTIFARLWVQTWLVLSLLVTIPIALLGAFLIGTSEKGVRTTLLRDHREIALRAAQAINLFVESPRLLLESTALLVGISHTDTWKQETLLVELGLNFPIFSRISSVSLQGEEVASSAPGSEKINFSKNKLIKKAAQGETAFSSIHVSKEGIPSMEMAVPYRHLGKVAGALHAEVSLRGMWDIVDHIQIGQSGFAYLVASDGAILAHQDKKMVLQNINLNAVSHIKRALEGENGSKVFTLPEGKRVLTAYAPAGKLGWALVTQQEWKEAFSFARTMTAQSRDFILGGLVLSVLASIAIAIAISRPVKKLALAANEVAAGNLEIRMASRREDEIGTLIRNFAHMIEGLKKAKEMERLTAMGMASARIAHELRNPLVAIKTYTQIFSRRKSEATFLNRFEATVPQEIDRLERMLEELTDFSKIERLQFTRVSLQVVVDETLMLLHEKLDQQKIRVHRRAPAEDKIVVRGDPERLKQVLINLVTNAAAAMEQGGELTLGLERRDSYARLSVTDTGKGIPSEELPKIFEPFHTLRKGGMGLGLSICRNIVEQHQGKIEVESHPDTGTTICVLLPLNN